MIKTIQVYDEHILNLIDQIDKECRKFDSSKYGIPPEPIRNAIKVIVYGWIYSQQGNVADAEKDAKKHSKQHWSGYLPD